MRVKKQGRCVLLAALIVVLAALGVAQAANEPVGIFEAHSDVGAVQIPGKAGYDAGTKSYTVTGSGENMWFGTDAFHYVWKKVSGDFRLGADIAFVGDGKNAHRKAVLLVRQSLDGDSAYADIAIHGDGLTSMQFRGAKSANTMEVQFGRPAPQRAEIVREGNLLYVRLDGVDMKLGDRPARMENFLPREVYIGIGVCSHETDVSETAVFTNVELATPAP